MLLVLLELSAAFDTVDHNVHFSRLKDRFCLSSKVLEWFQSYLEQCFQRVSVYGILSDIKVLLSGVPQSSVLGLLAFEMYSRRTNFRIFLITF